MENLFFVDFLMSSLVVSLLTLAIIGLKKVFRHHISAKWQYYIWMSFLILLILPFIPKQFLGFENSAQWSMAHTGSSQSIVQDNETLSQVESQWLKDERRLEDFALSVDNRTRIMINIGFISTWSVGVVICTYLTLKAYSELRRLRNTVHLIQNQNLERLFKQCKRELNITRTVIFGESSQVKMPMAFGLRKTYIVLPTKVIDQFSEEEMRYILLHELSHYKNKDIWMNYIMCVFQIIYWFNPLVYLAFKLMRTEREIVCDHTVLSKLEKKNHIEYGKTLIHFAEMLSSTRQMTMITSIGGSKRQIRERIERIIEFKQDTKWTQFKGLFIFLLIGGLILSQAPVISIMAYEKHAYDFGESQVVYEDLSTHFENVEGSFVLYDLQNDAYTIYNQEKSTKRVSPNSTYKIYSALMGLEDNIIQDKQSTLYWDGEVSDYEAWNHDQDLYSAMRDSVTWYFQDLDKAVGQEKIQYYLEHIKYGNKNMAGGISGYWMESSLRISPVEQVELLKDFYTYDILFQKKHIDLVKETLKLSERNGATLSGKTGSGIVNGRGVNGWFIGYVERESETYIFATNVEANDHVSGSLALEITLDILNDKAIY